MRVRESGKATGLERWITQICEEYENVWSVRGTEKIRSANVPFDMIHLEKERFDRALKIYFQMKRNRCSQSSVPKLDSKHE